MTKDLEETLNELGPGYGPLVERLRAPFAEPAAKPGHAAGFRRPAYLAAAALAAVLAFAAVMRPSASRPSASSAYPRCYTVALDADSAAIDELLATQRPDGGWASDFLTCQNAAALRGVPGAELAYRRAVRYLKAKGLSPLSADELKTRRLRATGPQDRGLYGSIEKTGNTNI